MSKWLLLFIFLTPLTAVAQYTITGKIVNADTRQPVADASVYLSNASAGAKSTADGSFTITGVRGGQYDLVVSIVGFTIYHQTVMVNNNISIPDIAIAHQVTMLKEVRIGPDKHWAEHFEEFKKQFLGTTDNAEQCKILNPHALDFDYDSEQNELTATASAALIIQNKALGYKITYQLNSFTMNYRSGQLYFDGAAFFEDLKGGSHAVKRWKANRQQVYQGSLMHFLRSIIANKVAEEGFTPRRLIRKLDPAYHGFGNKYVETLVTTVLSVGEYAHTTDVKGEYAMGFNDCLYVMYKDQQLGASIITIDAPYAYFDNNGIVINPHDVVMEGVWGQSRMAEMLPVDYEP